MTFAISADFIAAQNAKHTFCQRRRGLNSVRTTRDRVEHERDLCVSEHFLIHFIFDCDVSDGTTQFEHI